MANVEIVVKKTMREIGLFIKDKGLTKDDIVQVVQGQDGNWYILYQEYAEL